MTNKRKLRVLVVRAADQQHVLGMDWRADLPGFDKGEVVHSSDPRLPLTDRSPKFLTVTHESFSRADPSVGVIEVHEGPTALERKNVPAIWHRGYRIGLSFFPGTGNLSQTMPLPVFWEVSIDNRTIDTLRNDFDTLPKLAAAAFALVDSFIQQRIEERDSRF